MAKLFDLSDDIELREVTSNRDKKAFFLFPHWLYKDNPHWVPPMMKDEKTFFNKEKNPMYKTGDSRLYVVYQDRRIAGRVAVIANNQEVEEQQLIRFGWLDFVDDFEVSALLFQAVEDAAQEIGATQIEGPLGFCDLDKAGLLVEGFTEDSNMATWYNHSYYANHLERFGFKKHQDWLEYELNVPDKIPDRVHRLAELTRKKHDLRNRKIRNRADMKSIGVQVLKQMARARKNLYNFIPLTEEQMAYYAEQFVHFLPPEYVMILEDKDGRFVAFAATMPSLAKAAKQTKGYLFPFGFLRFLSAIKKNNRVELMCIGVAPDYQDKGITALIFKNLLEIYIKNGIKTVESNPEQEENHEVQTLWTDYESRQHKRRRVYLKHLA